MEALNFQMLDVVMCFIFIYCQPNVILYCTVGVYLKLKLSSILGVRVGEKTFAGSGLVVAMISQ